MRLLFIHSDHLEFEATEQAGPDDLAETEGVPMDGAMEECATVFISVESEDEASIDAAVTNAVAELEDVTDQLDTPNIVLYPYAHLSEDLARHVTGQQEETAADDQDETEAKPSEWHVLGPDGELKEPIENPTVQIDVESADRFDITYNDGAQEHTPIILHYSPTGGIERVMAALLEQAARQDTPRLPTWLSPTQVRLIPVGNDHVEYCDELVATLVDSGIRADIDDRDESVGKRIATAETDWVPYYAVVGDRELENPVFDVTIRGRDEEELSINDLATTVLEEVGDKPAKPRYLPRYVSDHPDFA